MAVATTGLREVASRGADSSGPPNYVALLGRRRAWAIVWLWTGVCAAAHAGSTAYSWHYFALGAGLLTHPSNPAGGLHVYGSHPELQIGPLALLAAAALQVAGTRAASVLAPAVLTLLGPVILWLLVGARDRYLGRTRDGLVVTAGALFLPVWCEVATHYAHLDDALALLLTVLALRATLAGHAMLTGLSLAAAADSKPWATAFLLLVVGLPAGRRLRAFAVAVAGVALAWLPFLAGDPRTMSLAHFTIDNVDNSALRALGVQTAGTPGWDRPAQLAVAVAVALIAVARGRWWTVITAGVAARILLDPATYPYYTSGLVVGTLAADLLCRRRRFPMWTGAATLWYAGSQLAGPVLPASWLGDVRAGYCLLVLAALCLLPSEKPALPRGRPGQRIANGERRAQRRAAGLAPRTGGPHRRRTGGRRAPTWATSTSVRTARDREG